MIDDPKKAKELVRKMEQQLPIAARPGPAAFRMMRAQGKKVAPNEWLQIEFVGYAGDEGGIVCAMQVEEGDEMVFAVSVTQLEIDPQHPLAGEIRAYQRERTRRLAQAEGLRAPRPSATRPRRGKRR